MPKPRRLLLPAALILLAYGFWSSADFTRIAAGIAVFLFGMMSLEEGFKAFTGGILETLLRNTTDRLWKSIGFGIVTTSLMQSSSLVSLITISFLSAGMIGLGAGIGIIIGSNLGTTSGAWLIAGLGLKVDISAYAMPLLVFGVIGLLQQSKPLKGAGYGLIGLGFLFLGIHYMKDGFEAFGSSFDLSAYAVPGYPGLFLFALIGLLVTVIMQSSHATLVLTITALAAGQITYENALALAIGANMGTTITALIGAVSANVEGRRLAAAHLIFNVTTGVVAIALIHPLRWIVDELAVLLGIAAQDYMLKLALFHTLFNLLGLLLITPFVDRLVIFLERVVRAVPAAAEQPRYLNTSALEVPAAAVEAVRKEVEHLYENAFGLIAHGLSLRRHVIRSDQPLAEAVETTRRIMPLDVDDIYEDKIKGLHSAIIEFISQAQSRELPAAAADELYALRRASRDIVEAVKGMKHLHKNLTRHGLSANPAIRRQYDELRLHTAEVLREIETLRAQPPDAVTLLSLDDVRLELERFDRQLNATLDELIRQRRITAKVATSLMNDGGYVHEIGRNLIDMAQIVFVPRTPDRQVAQQLALDEKDIERVLGDEHR